MSDKKRKLSRKSQPPKKKSKYKHTHSYSLFPEKSASNNTQSEDNAPKCPNPYKPSNQSQTTRYPSQDNGLLSTSSQHNNHSNNHNKNKNKKSKSNNRKSHSKNYRKSVPSLRTSQDSLPPSTPIPNTQSIPTNNISPSPSNQTNDVEIRVKNAAQNGRYVSQNKDDYLANCCYSFTGYGSLWILIGAVLGVISCYCICLKWPTCWMCGGGSGRPKPLDNYTYVKYNGSCPCDVSTNKTCIECKECMDKYWDMHGIHMNCMNDKQRLEKEINKLYEEIEELERKINDGEYINDINDLNKCDEIQSKLNKCNDNNKKLREELRKKKEEMCFEYIDKIGELKHELGECNVEWDSCEMSNRQKKALDKKRIEEIKKQKHKFELCNEQLKRYKNEAKKNRGKKKR
eukprot:91093_1